MLNGLILASRSLAAIFVLGVARCISLLVEGYYSQRNCTAYGNLKTQPVVLLRAINVS